MVTQEKQDGSHKSNMDDTIVQTQMSDEIDEELARQLQAEFDEEFSQVQSQEANDLKYAQNLVGKHEISESDNSDNDQEKKPFFTDSDKTISEDELQNLIKKKIKSKRKDAAPTRKLHELSDSDEDESTLISKTSTSANSQSSSKPKLHDLSDSGDEGQSSARKGIKSTQRNEEPKLNCKFGAECFRKNPAHRKMFNHPDSGESQPKQIKLSNNSCDGSTLRSNIFGFYLTKVAGIPSDFNVIGAVDIKDILSEKMGNLVESAQFNYMTDIRWLIEQYPSQFRNKPLVLVHGEQRESKKALTREASAYSNITLCQAKLEIVFGTHHTKMMLLRYDNGIRVVIHTANLIPGDWRQKTQGVWISPLLPPTSQSTNGGDSVTNFKRDLLEYLYAYKANELKTWCEQIVQHDFSSVRVYLVGSTPGRHVGPRMNSFGHLKLRKILRQHGPKSSVTSEWPVICQFSSIGSLGASPDHWLYKEFLPSLSGSQDSSPSKKTPKIQMIFPSVENVRLSLEGYPAGSCLPYSKDVAKKQVWLHAFFNQWRSERRGRSFASPHIKTYTRISPMCDSVAWFLVTSANLSKAAWGAMEKNGTQFMIRSYEIGVLFLPQHFNSSQSIKISEVHPSDDFSLPFDVPLVPYGRSDEPWIWNVSHTRLPDRHGNMWCPS